MSSVTQSNRGYFNPRAYVRHDCDDLIMEVHEDISIHVPT